MSVIVIKCGFQPIDTQNLRLKSISKGTRLVKSCHVSDVSETIVIGHNSKVKGLVIPETSVNKHLYQVEIELNQDRTINTSSCGCKAGNGKCKHIAAICIFINLENASSKTSEPLVWNKPSCQQLQKYSKGMKAEDLFPCKTPRPVLPTNITVDDVQNISTDHLKINCAFVNMLKVEETCTLEREIVAKEQKITQTILNNVVGALLDLQTAEKAEYSKIVVDDNMWRKVCIESVSQSHCSMWFLERFRRITCSKKVHQIKTRQKNFEALAKQFKNMEQSAGPMNDAMKYGIETEPTARTKLENSLSKKVYEVGLVISKYQPFLACSPDGIVLNDLALIEIKCPHTCRDIHIVDRKAQKSNVPYLHFEENGEISLGKNHIYYTQIQASMYVLNINVCYFFVCSRKDQVLITVLRNENFLQELIPKVEYFYFTYFLPLLVKTK